MTIWNDINQNIKKSSQQWLSWAKQHAQEIGDAGMRHIERQDLLSERKQLVQRLGEEVANRFLIEQKKTLRADSQEIQSILDRIGVIDERLEELARYDQSEGAKEAGEADEKKRETS